MNGEDVDLWAFSFGDSMAPGYFDDESGGGKTISFACSVAHDVSKNAAGVADGGLVKVDVALRIELEFDGTLLNA